MANIREQEVLHVNEKGKPIAVSYDPGAFGNESVRTMLKSQITSPNPLEIHCRIRGVYITIEAWEFDLAKQDSLQDQQDFIDRSESLIKGLETREVIFAEPLKDK